MKSGPGTTLFTIYQNLFFRGTVDDIKRFRELGAKALLTPEDQLAFEEELERLNDGNDPRLGVNEIEALAYLMAASRQASLVRPWDDDPTW